MNTEQKEPAEVVYVDLSNGVAILWEQDPPPGAAVMRISVSERPSCLWLSVEVEGRVIARVEVLANAGPVEMQEALSIALEEGWV